MIQLLVQLVAYPCAHAVARQQGGRAFNHVAIIDDALTLLLGGIDLRHLPVRANRHPKPFGQICASAKIAYGRAAVVQAPAIGIASCWDRMCRYGYNSGGDVVE